MKRGRTITVGVTGGSGAIYARRLLDILAQQYDAVDVVFSNAARQVFEQELGVTPPSEGIWRLSDNEGYTARAVTVWAPNDYSAPFASGSNCAEQMVIVPCSMSTVASIAHGVDQNVLHHAAAVTLKESRQLIIVPRETPLSAVHLRNLLALAELGVRVIPAMPGFYGGQSTFSDLIDFVLQKIVNQLGLNVMLARPWGEEASPL